MYCLCLVKGFPKNNLWISLLKVDGIRSAVWERVPIAFESLLLKISEGNIHQRAFSIAFSARVQMRRYFFATRLRRMATLVLGPRQRQLKYRFYNHVVFTDGQIHALSVLAKIRKYTSRHLYKKLPSFLIIMKYSFFLQSFICSATSWRMYGLGGIIAKSCFVLNQAVGYRHA